MKVSNRGWNIRDIAERRRDAARVRELLAELEPSGPHTRIVPVVVRARPSEPRPTFCVSQYLAKQRREREEFAAAHGVAP